MTNTVAKVFKFGFIVDNAKLVRILNIIEQRYSEVHEKFEPRFDVTFRNGKNVTLNNIDAVFELDNAIKNPIKSLVVSTNESSKESKLRSIIEYRDDERQYNVELFVGSNDAKQANQLFAELEEQIERTLRNSLIDKFLNSDALQFIVFIFGVMILLSFMLFGIISAAKARADSITDDEVSQLITKSQNAISLEDKVDFLFEAQSKQIAHMRESEPGFNISSLINLNTLFIALPLLIIAGCIFYLLKYCYPDAVFLWGDYKDYYEQLVSRRRTLWLAVMLSILIGIIGNLFVLSLSKVVKFS